MRIILASKSPRRQELLKTIGINDYSILPADCDETVPEGLTPAETVMYLAEKKAKCVAGKEPDGLVIAADTLVYLDDALLGKPGDAEGAKQMLERLSGREHTVYTGVALALGKKIIKEYEATKVFFRDLTDGEISAYIRSGEPMDKAGAYGIQGLGAVFVRRLEGDYFNVMGLPLCRLYKMLEKLGITILG